MRLQKTLDGRALYAFPSSVDQPYDAEARGLRLMQIFVDHVNDVARLKGVKVDRLFYWQAYRLIMP